jgi:hypothetical protein
MQAELSRADEYAGVVILLPDDAGVNVDMFDPVEQEQIEHAFREAGPSSTVAGYGGWEELSRYGDPVWFENVLRSLEALGYTYKVT